MGQKTAETHSALAAGQNVTPEHFLREGARSGPSLLHRAAALLHRCAARNERLQVCETVSLGGRRSVALIECDGQRFLAGLSANGVETLVPVAANSAREVSR